MGVTLRGDLGSMGGRDREAKPGRTAAGRFFQWLEHLHRAAPGASQGWEGPFINCWAAGVALWQEMVRPMTPKHLPTLGFHPAGAEGPPTISRQRWVRSGYQVQWRAPTPVLFPVFSLGFPVGSHQQVTTWPAICFRA